MSSSAHRGRRSGGCHAHGRPSADQPDHHGGVLRARRRDPGSSPTTSPCGSVVIRSANPEWFLAHFDVEAIQQFPRVQPIPTAIGPYDEMCETLRTMPKPTIAVIEGRVGGGGSELALGCDMRFADPERPSSTSPRSRIGIIPGGRRHGATAPPHRPEPGARGRCSDVTTSTPPPPSVGAGSTGCCPPTRSMSSWTGSPGGSPGSCRTRWPRRRRASCERRSACTRIWSPRRWRSTATLADDETHAKDAAVPRPRRSDAGGRTSAR